MENEKLYSIGIVRRPFNERIIIYILSAICILLLPMIFQDWISLATIHENIKGTNEIQHVEMFTSILIYSNIFKTMIWGILLITDIYLLKNDFKIRYTVENIEIKYLFNTKIYTYNDVTEYFLKDSVRIYGRKELVISFYDGTTIKVMENYENINDFIDMLNKIVGK